MKKFLLTCVLLFAIVFVPIALAETIDLLLRSRTPFVLPKNKTVLFIGDSHIERSVNEKFIPGAFNNAKSADFYLNMFPRIRKLLKANPQIRTVFIAVTPENLIENADWIISNGDAEQLIQLNIPFYNQDELIDSRKTIKGMFMDVRSFERAMGRILRGRTTKLDELGGFVGVEKCDLLKEAKNDDKPAKRKLEINPPHYGNELTIKYLRKIVEFVRVHGVRVIFLNPPLYHAGEFFDVPYFESILKEKFPDVEFWDYADFPIPNEGFQSVNHLNVKGAEIFSKELERRMRQEGTLEPEET